MKLGVKIHLSTLPTEMEIGVKIPCDCTHSIQNLFL